MTRPPVAIAANEQFREAMNKIDDLHRLYETLMVPQPGHTKTLLDRMAAVTIQIESGENSMAWLARKAALGKALLWLVGLCATAWAAIKLGIGFKE